MLRSVEWKLRNDVSWKSIDPIFKGKEILAAELPHSCVILQKNADLIYIAAGAWYHE